MRIALLTLGLLEDWRSHLGLDLHSVLIVLATAVVTMEKLTRQEFDTPLHDIRCDMPPELLTRCYVSSIAVAAGLNRETARRKVRQLIDDGVLIADARGSIRLSTDYTRKVNTSDMLRRHLLSFVRSANGLLKDDVIELHAGEQ